MMSRLHKSDCTTTSTIAARQCNGLSSSRRSQSLLNPELRMNDDMWMCKPHTHTFKPTLTHTESAAFLNGTIVCMCFWIARLKRICSLPIHEWKADMKLEKTHSGHRIYPRSQAMREVIGIPLRRRDCLNAQLSSCASSVEHEGMMVWIVSCGSNSTIIVSIVANMKMNLVLYSQSDVWMCVLNVRNRNGCGTTYQQWSQQRKTEWKAFLFIVVLVAPNA